MRGEWEKACLFKYVMPRIRTVRQCSDEQGGLFHVAVDAHRAMDSHLASAIVESIRSTIRGTSTWLCASQHLRAMTIFVCCNCFSSVRVIRQVLPYDVAGWGEGCRSYAGQGRTQGRQTILHD